MDIRETARSYADGAALAAGNPLLLEYARVSAEVRRLEELATAWRRGQDGLRWTVTWPGGTSPPGSPDGNEA